MLGARNDRSRAKIAEQQAKATAVRTQSDHVRAEMRKLYDLYIADGLSVEQFKALNTPLYDRLSQFTLELGNIEGEDAALQINDLTVDAIALEARSLSALWPTLNVEGKQRLAATLCSEIIVPDKDPDAPIEIVFSHSAPPKHEAPIRIWADSSADETEAHSSENFSEISNPLNTQRHLDVTPPALHGKRMTFLAAAVWNQIARSEELETDAAKVAFRLDPDQIIAMVNVWMMMEEKAGTPPVVARRLPELLPLLAEVDAVQGYVSQHPSMRNAIPEILDATEAALIAQANWRLTDEEAESLKAALLDPASLERWKSAAEMAELIA